MESCVLLLIERMTIYDIVGMYIYVCDNGLTQIYMELSRQK